jgi:hypothetical protein
MKHIIVTLVLTTSLFNFVKGQDTIKKKITLPAGKRNAISAGVALPMGNFSNTHFIGFEAGYMRSNRRFGQLKINPSKPLGLVAAAGGSNYLGKNEKLDSFTYAYANYMHVYIHGGIIYNPCRYGNIILILGPGMSFYNGTERFVFGVTLLASYYFSSKFSVSPGISAMKESISDPLWTGSLKMSYFFNQ